MKRILKSIGGVFVAIWRWIKNTAWVQPLLIVGAIFGVIFSIPSITSGIKSLIDNKNSAETFYSNYQLSLDGGVNSDAEKLIYRYNQIEEKKVTDIQPNDLKYFLFFTKKGDSNANGCKEAFEIVRDNWGTQFTITDGKPFKFYTIFTDEVTDQTKTDKSAFSQFIDRQSGFFETAADHGAKTNYYLNGKITKDQLNKLAIPEADTFQIPTIILVDWTNREELEKANKNVGITQLMFGINGSDNWGKAQSLADCWNGKGDFAPQKN